MTDNRVNQDNPGEFILYQTKDGRTRLEVRMANETVWLTQKAMAELFPISVPNINQHLKAIYEEGELQPEATTKRYLIVQAEGRQYLGELFNA